MIDWVWKVCDKVEKGEGWIEKWNKGVIIPIVKKGEGAKGEGAKVKDYRG